MRQSIQQNQQHIFWIFLLQQWLLLETLGLEKERIWIRWVSASEGQKFADTMKEMTEEIKKLGPNPIAKHWNI